MASALDPIVAELGLDADDLDSFFIRYYVEQHRGVEEAQWLVIWRANRAWV